MSEDEDDFYGKEWDKDSVIDKTQLMDENLRSPKLHAKWLRYWRYEKGQLAKMQAAYKKLYALKREFAINPSAELEAEYGWKPDTEKVLRSAVDKYLEKDTDLEVASIDLAVQQGKVDFLSEVIKEIGRRSYHLKNAIDERRFINGG